MKKNKNIPIRNIFYMLAYTFNSSSLIDTKKTELEDFTNAYEMYLELLDIILPKIIKGGIEKDYVSKTDELTVIKGKLNLVETINNNSLIKNRVYVEHDEFTENIFINKIIKSTLLKIINDSKTPVKYKKKFRNYIVYFSNVDFIELTPNIWESVLFNRNNDRYKFTIYICKLVTQDYLITEDKGMKESINIKDNRELHIIFEKFVLQLLKQETNYRVHSPILSWKVDDNYSKFLPRMETDIVVRNKKNVLIVDTKFYSKNINIYENDKRTHLSNNLYQIFSYVNNWEDKNDNVSGLILYAKTEKDIQPNDSYKIEGNRYYINNINLNQPFSNIKKDIIHIVNSTFLEN